MAFFRRTETPAQDNARTRDLLDEADKAFATEEAADTAFAEVVMDGLMGDKATTPYPPPGHTYPRRTT